MVSPLKKNLISIFLIAGAVALNLAVLGQAACAGSRAISRQVNEAAVTALRHAHVVIAAQPGGHESGKQASAHASAVKRGFGPDDSGIHLDLNFITEEIEPAPRSHAPHALAITAAIFTDLAPVPQDRPPAPA